MNRLREKIESIVFAGLKPAAPRTQAAAPIPETLMGRLRQRIDNWVSGTGHADPLYLSNRTTAQKLKSWLVIAVPVLILVGGIGISLAYLNPPEATRANEPTPAEVASKMLPNLKDLKIEGASDLEVVEVGIDRSKGVRMVGSVRNKSVHTIATALLSCELTDASGTQLGSVTVHLEDIPASSVKTFELPVQQTDANFVLIREILTR